jgi:FADH2 O2-dependent halogenase
MPRLAYRARTAAGPGWALLPSAAAFVDPLFSTGFPLTLLGVERLGRALEGGWATGADAMRPGAAEATTALERYADATLEEADGTAAFVAGCYAGFPRFDRFAAYSMFYFAAASFSEAARRLDAPVCPKRFLCADMPAFAHACTRLSPRALPTEPSSAPGGVVRRNGVNGRVDHGVDHGVDDGLDYGRAVGESVALLNVAGLCDPSKRNWYGVDTGDTVRGAAKLGLSAARVRAAYAHLGLA